ATRARATNERARDCPRMNLSSSSRWTPAGHPAVVCTFVTQHGSCRGEPVPSVTPTLLIARSSGPRGPAGVGGLVRAVVVHPKCRRLPRDGRRARARTRVGDGSTVFL